MTVAVDAPQAAGTYSNTGTASSGVADPQPSNNSSTVAVRVQPLPTCALPAGQATLHGAVMQKFTNSSGLFEDFVQACLSWGVSREVAAGQWLQLLKFKHYTFCKSHAVSYGLIAWTGTWLKAHHPLCFWTAVLNNNQGAYPRRVYVEALKRAGIELRLPCVNHSRETFSLEGSAIRTGLGAIRALPAELRAAIARLVAERG